MNASSRQELRMRNRELGMNHPTREAPALGGVIPNSQFRIPNPQPSGVRTAFLIVDTESVPDGRLISEVKYPGEGLSPDDAIRKAQEEAREQSRNGSDFLPVSFQVPIAVCVVRVANDFTLQAVTCLDTPHYRAREVVMKFWLGVARYQAKIVTFNGRGFDMPLLELAAFRYGFSGRDYFLNSRNRFNGHLDLLDWLTNFGAARLAGGLDLLAKMIGKPGKMDVAGDQVYRMWQEGRLAQINDYCLCDTLDTYFVFLRTRVLTGDISLEQEADLTARAREFLEAKAVEVSALKEYLANWREVPAWP
jgi:predicted PolB exonuclease-like 3'-5' exonuclease